MALFGPRIQPTPEGDFRLRLGREERRALRALPAQLRELLGTDDPSLRRLFPPAYEDDPDSEREYRGLVGDELLAGRRRALDVMEETAGAERLTPEQLEAWLSALNDLRLVLGTRLGVTEETLLEDVSPRDPRAPEYALYGYLSWLQEQAVAAASSTLPTRRDDEG
jgi:hypothetical protein